jgi:hypothetical protein
VRDAENAAARAARGHVPAMPSRVSQTAGLGIALARPAGVVATPFPSTTPDKAARPLVPEQRGVWYVNGKDINYTLTPGGYVTIHGRGFGDVVGSVTVFGTVDRRTFALQVDDWHRDEVFALLPPGIRGMRDQPVRLQIITRDGMVFVDDRGRFRAEREEISLGDHLDRVIQFASASTWKPTLSPDGSVERYEAGSSIDCQAPGSDRLAFAPPAGFEVIGISAEWGRTDSGDEDALGGSGSRVFTPGYSFGEWFKATVATGPGREAVIDAIAVNWGVWRSHSSGTFTNGVDRCLSEYKVTLRLAGPAGVAPF